MGVVGLKMLIIKFSNQFINSSDELPLIKICNQLLFMAVIAREFFEYLWKKNINLSPSRVINWQCPFFY